MFQPQIYDWSGRPDAPQPGRGIDLGGRGGLLGGFAGGLLGGPIGGLVGRGFGTAIDVDSANQDISRAGGHPDANWGSAMANGLSFGLFGQSARDARDIGVQSGNEAAALSAGGAGFDSGPGTPGYDGGDYGGGDFGPGGYANGGDVDHLTGPNPEGPDDGFAPLKYGETVIDADTSAQMGGHAGIMRKLAQALCK